MFAIEKGIPAPVRGSSAEYPFAQMEIGDSFFVPAEFASYEPEKVAEAKRVVARLTSARTNASREDKKFSMRRSPTGMRVWRTA